jgi:uncharacterized LabA/DUF88 family protein
MNMPSIYLYVDGESRYTRAKKCLERIYGENADLKSVRYREKPPMRVPPIAIYQPALFFWDFWAPCAMFGIDRSMDYGQMSTRKVYFTSFTGDSDGVHQARVTIREAGFEPEIVQELKNLRDHRENELKHHGSLIKPKGVDINLAVRMLEDAYHGNYDWCVLATSDIDYLPVIRAVRRMGKQVFVMGDKEAIGKDSAFLYLPERFFDVGHEFMRRTYHVDS